MRIDPEVIKAIAVTAELTGTVLSEAAVRVFAADLARYPAAAVLASLERCRREVKGRLTLSDVIERIEAQDGRPGAEEAWSIAPRDEASTTVMTDEIAIAWGAALPLVQLGDHVAARMTFREVYNREVESARQAAKPVRWFASLGQDLQGRAPVLREAVARGRLSHARAVSLLPQLADGPIDFAGQKQLQNVRALLLTAMPSPEKGDDQAA